MTLSFAVGASCIYVAGIALEACDCRLRIGNFDFVRFTWYIFGGMDSWMGLALAMGTILSMDILTTMDACDYLWIRFLCLAFQLVQDFMIF